MSSGRPHREKTFAIGEWLKGRFAGLSVVDTFDVPRASQFYLLIQGIDVRHRILVSEEFLADHPIEEIVRLIDLWRTDLIIQAAGRRLVVVTNQGAGVPAEGDVPIRPSTEQGRGD